MSFKNIKILFAKFISGICEPPLISFFVFLFLNLTLILDFNRFIGIEFLSLLFATLFPVFIVQIWVKNKNLSNLDNKNDRIYPLIFISLNYLLGTILLWYFNAPILTLILFICYTLNTPLIFFISLKWKISIHSMGIAGPITILIFQYGFLGSLVGLLSILVMWSRMILNKHTLLQVITGASLGFLLASSEIYILFKLLNKDVNIVSMLLMILAISLPYLTVSLAGYLNDKGVADVYTRKIFHFIAFSSFILFLNFATFSETLILLISGTITVAISCISGNDFIWLKGIERKSDFPNGVLYVILSLISSVIWLIMGILFFSKLILTLGTAFIAIGNTMVEPIDTNFGKHKYEVKSLKGNSSQRSLEGSLSVGFSCFLISLFITKNGVISFILAIVAMFVKVISPRGIDNITVPLISSIVYIFIS